MTEQTFHNFDLLIEKFGRRYRARVIASPAGQASGEFGKPLSTSELNDFIIQMGQPKQGARQADSAEFGAIKQFGEMLFSMIFTKDVYACYLRSLDIASKEEKGLRIRLRIDVPEFHDLPWEYLYNSQVNQFLALSNDTPIVRYFDLPYTTQVLSVEPPLKILAMISSPEGYPKLDVEQHWNRLTIALEPLIRKGLVKLERLESPTLDALQESLRREDVHIFHFIGHGKYLDQSQDGKLLLEDENGKGTPVSGQRLATLLHDSDSLRLVVLSACEGARTSAEDPYAGVAQTLVQQGIPAVIAMQFEIFEDAAIKFAQEFYEAIVDGNPVDAALSEARKAIYVSGNDREWGTPVLFTRSPDSVLFRRIDSAQKPSMDKIFTGEKSVINASGIKDFPTSLSMLSKNPKVLYSGLILAIVVLAIIGSAYFRNRAMQIAAVTQTAISQENTVTAAQRDSLTATQEAKITATANAVLAFETSQTVMVTNTATATATPTQIPATPTVTGTATPITPPLGCLNRWTVKLIPDDTSLSTEPTSDENGCVIAYKDLGISSSGVVLSFLQDSFRIRGNFGVSTPLPKDPKEISLTIKLFDIAGGGQGEFWIALSNGTDPEKDSMSIAVQPNGYVKYYSNGNPTTLIDTIIAKPSPYTYEIQLTIDGNRVNSVVNSTYYRNNLAVNGGPKYLYLGYTKRSNQGTVSLQVDVVNLKFK